jgi:hypothetical protein
MYLPFQIMSDQTFLHMFYDAHVDTFDAGWSSPVARQAHNLKVVGSNPAPAPKVLMMASRSRGFFVFRGTGS